MTKFVIAEGVVDIKKTQEGSEKFSAKTRLTLARG